MRLAGGRLFDKRNPFTSSLLSPLFVRAFHLSPLSYVTIALAQVAILWNWPS